MRVNNVCENKNLIIKMNTWITRVNYVIMNIAMINE